MSDITDLLQPMKDRLAAATPGPWFREYGDVITTDPDPRDVEEGYDDPRSLRVVRAAPHLAKREPQAIKDATFIASAPTDQAKLIAAIEGVEALAGAWQARGEHLLEFSKTAPEDVAEALFTDAGSMLHNATLVRAALTQALGGDTA